MKAYGLAEQLVWDSLPAELTPEQMAKLNEASATTPPYPYWHQRGFKERNPAAAMAMLDLLKA